jgi:hypothetical protein
LGGLSLGTWLLVHSLNRGMAPTHLGEFLGLLNVAHLGAWLMLLVGLSAVFLDVRRRQRDSADAAWAAAKASPGEPPVRF